MPAVCAACIKPAQQKILCKLVNFSRPDLFLTVCVIYLAEAVRY